MRFDLARELTSSARLKPNCFWNFIDINSIISSITLNWAGMKRKLFLPLFLNRSSVCDGWVSISGCAGKYAHLSFGSKMWWSRRMLGSKPANVAGGGRGGMLWRNSSPVPDLSINRRDAALSDKKLILNHKSNGMRVPYLYWSSPPYIGRFITSNLGKWLINIVRTHGAIVWVCGDRKWMFKTITVTHMLWMTRGRAKD